MKCVEEEEEEKSGSVKKGLRCSCLIFFLVLFSTFLFSAKMPPMLLWL